MNISETQIPVISGQSMPEVMIAGAGPVGLFLACELALAKCSVLILEKSSELKWPLKALPFGIRGLSAPTIEALHRRGLLQELQVHRRLRNPHQNSGEGSQRQVGHFAGIPILEGNVDSSRWPWRLPSSTPLSLISEMQELETVLTDRAVALGVAIRRGLAVTEVQQNDHIVEVVCGSETFRTQWLVGCDGGRSAVRKAGSFGFAGTEPEFTGYTAKVDIADGSMLKPGRNVTPTGMYLQSQPGYLVIQDFDGGSFHDANKPITREHLERVLRRVSATNVTVDALHVATTWTDRARQAEMYRDRRILLAGDAAHVHSPLGGQGLNLGIGDAMNLGWKLASTIKRNAPDSLLESYQIERHPIGRQVLEWSRAQVAVMNLTPAARALNAIVRDVINTKEGATYFAGRVWGVSNRYDLGDAHPLTGHSVPNFAFAGGITIGDQMTDGRGVLLDFNDDPQLAKLASDYAEQLRYVCARSPERFGISAALIRPDGIVAWASDAGSSHCELRQAAARWFDAAAA